MPLLYHSEHTWIDATNLANAIVGITAHLRNLLDEIVFVEMPAVGSTFAQGAVAAVVESVKTAADVHLPVSGEIIAVNDAVSADPALVNIDPENRGWFVRLHLSNPQELDGLMDAAAYARHTGRS